MDKPKESSQLPPHSSLIKPVKYNPLITGNYADFGEYKKTAALEVETFVNYVKNLRPGARAPGAHTRSCLEQASRYCPAPAGEAGLYAHVESLLQKNPELSETLEFFFLFLNINSPETYAHVMRVTSLTMSIAHAWNRSGGQPAFEGQELAELCIAAMAHDLGKMFIPDAILHAGNIMSQANYDSICRRINALDVTEDVKDSLCMTMTQLLNLPYPPLQAKEQFLLSVIVLTNLHIDGAPLLSPGEQDMMERYVALVDDNFSIMQHHARLSRDLLEKLPLTGLPRNLPFVAAAHHENLDGSGYPDGLKEHDIPLSTQILAVADRFEAMTADRSYRRAMQLKEACALLEQDARLHEDGLPGKINLQVFTVAQESVFKSFTDSYKSKAAVSSL